MTAPESRVTPERKLLDLLGLAARAGRVSSGTDAVRQAAREGKISLVLLAADASPTQHAKLLPLLEARQLPYSRVADRGHLGAAIGRGPVAAVGIADINFARRASALIAELHASQDRG